MTKPPSNPDKLALIIGIDTYTNTSLENLPSCKKDAEDMSEVLSEQGYTKFGSKPMIGSELYEEFGWYRIHKAIVDLFDKAEAGQTLLFYFSRHGLSRGQDIFLATPQVDPPNPMLQGFSLANLTSLTNSSKSMKIVSIIDRCYSAYFRNTG